MKTIGKITSILVLLLIASPSYAQTDEQKKMPPMKMLPKDGETKHMYQLPSPVKYEVFDAKGNFIAKGEGEWIDMTKYDNGIYYIRYNGETYRYELKNGLDKS